MKGRLWIAKWQQRGHMALARWHAMARDWHRKQAEAHAGKAAYVAFRRLGLKWRKDKR